MEDKRLNEEAKYLQQHIFAEQISLLFKQYTLPAATASLVATIIVAALWNHVPHKILIGWYLLQNVCLLALEHRRPLYATIIGLPENHAVVIDGYDDQDYFHLNFGWGGHFNGYFLVNNDTWFGTGDGEQKFFTNFANIYLLSPTPITVNKQDSLALVALHNAIGGYEATHWDLTKSVWTWPGVLVMNDRVIRLTLNSPLPPSMPQSIAPEIGNLTALQELNIGGCLNGNIPISITNLTDLKKLNIVNSYVYIAPTLYKGNFKSALPANIGKLTKLEWLSISGALEGTIPASIGSLSNLKLLRIYQDTTYSILAIKV